MTIQVDHLIVGRGLAGLAVAHQLSKLGASFAIVAKNEPQSSLISAGMVNPISGMKLNPTWLAEELLEYALAYYQDLEASHQEKLYYAKPVLKIFTTEAQGKLHQEKLADPNYKKFYLENFPFKHQFNKINLNFGGALGAHTYFLDVEKYLMLSKKIFEHQIIEDEFLLADCRLTDQINQWKNYAFKNLILCEGSAAAYNPIHNFINFRMAKGEIITAEIADLSTDFIYNYGHFALPFKSNIFKIGATYTWDQLDSTPTTAAKDLLVSEFKKYIGNELKIIKHDAGVRPIITGQKPGIGRHPFNSNVYMFNGLGSKGTMYAPYFAKRLVDFIEKDSHLPAEVDITQRFVF
jgi:glycine oxidase